MKFPKEVLKDIEKHLQKERKLVHVQIGELKIQDPFSDTGRLTDNAASDTEAKEESDHERYQAMLEELKLKDEAVAAALIRIDNGTYGFCKNCGKMIDTERLAVLPTATWCMKCEAAKKSK